MFLQSIKFLGFVAIVTAGTLGTIVVGQQAKEGRDPGSQSAVNAVASTPQEQAKLVQTERAEADRQELQRLNQAARQATDKKTQMIKLKLDQPIDVDFPPGTTLEQVLKHIKQQTTDEDYPGIPIYVNPIGLQEAGHNMVSMIDLNRKKCPVREVLWWALHPLQLSYIVKDGFLTIDSRTSVTEMRVEEMERKLDRLLEALVRLEGPRE